MDHISLVNKALNDTGLTEYSVLGMYEGKGYISLALPYYIQDEAFINQGFCRVASFAVYNQYDELVSRLKKVSLFIRNNTQYKKSDFQIFCNSHIDEKKLAYEQGLGFIGKNSLIIHPKWGPGIVIGHIALPFKVENTSYPIENRCGNCQKCVLSCPTNAILGNNQIDKNRCLQYYAPREEVLPSYILECWTDLLYGCDTCIRCCPQGLLRYSKIDLIHEKKIGPSVKAEDILLKDDTALNMYLKGTVLEMKFISRLALRRNAILSLRGLPQNDIKQILNNAYINNSHPAIIQACNFVRK